MQKERTEEITDKESDREPNIESNKETSQRHHVYRLAPCPAYDVEGMESWLCDMAQKGLFLIKDGFFAGVAAFEYGISCKARYRLEAAQKNTSMWAEDGGEPDQEQVDLGKKYAWDYVAKRGDFYIYRTFEPGTRELNTDPEVQALALNEVKKRRTSHAVLVMVEGLVILSPMNRNSGLLLAVIQMRTWFFLLILLFVLWMLAGSLIELVSFGRLQKKLRESGGLTSGKNWRSGAAYYHGKKFLRFVLGIALVCILLHKWSDSVMNVGKVPLDSYAGVIPFATIRDFADGEGYYRMTMQRISESFNTVEEWSDWLAPQCIEYNEHAQITMPDGRILEGGLYVEYYETVNETIARWLAEECYRIDKRQKSYEAMEAPALNVEFAAAYRNRVHVPTILIQDGNIVIRAFFYQTSSNYTVAFEEWVGKIADIKR